MRPPSNEKIKKSANFQNIQPRVSSKPKRIFKDDTPSALYSDFKSKLKLTKQVNSRFRQCFDTSSSNDSTTLSRKEQVELEKSQFLKKCPKRK